VKYTEAQRLAASQWFFDIHDAEEPSPELLQEWLRWLDADEAHRRAFDAVESAYHQIQAAPGTMAAPKQSAPYDGSASVAAWRDRAIHRQGAARRAAIAAGVAVALIGAATWVYEGMPPFWRPASGEYTTRTGEHMSLTLADGSHVDLGARSRLEVGFSPQSRDVRLLGGEAFFSVHKDAARPFRVHVLEGIVTAVGTAFNVRATEDRVTVAVSEGVVSVGDAGDSGRLAPTSSAALLPHVKSLRLAAGDQLSFKERPPSASAGNAELTRVDPAQSARWREGWLVYRDEPLRYVIADVERYTTREIAVADSVPDSLRFTGAVSKDSVTEWVEALPGVFPVQVKRQGTRLQLSASAASPGAGER
jgi:transmembrane sensor